MLRKHRFYRRRKFNTFILKRTQLTTIIIALVFIGSLLFTIPLSKMNSSLLLCALRHSLPSLHLTESDTSKSEKRDFGSLFNPQRVLAESIPFLNLPPYEEEFQPLEDTPAEPEAPPPLPPLPENTYPILNSQVISKNLGIRNETTYQPDLQALLSAPLSFSSPEILIVHTHASESYKNDEFNYYTEGESDRSLDTALNMVRIGEELATELKARGFKVTHARNINDHPSYNQSYNRTLDVINSHLQANGNIQIVLDLHRDAAVKSDGTKLKFTASVNGESVSQIMLVCGTNQRGLPNDTWQENLKFALKLQNYMENTFPGLARPLNLRQERFNTHATKGSMIIEIGTSGNTLQESLGSVKYLADALAHVISTSG